MKIVGPLVKGTFVERPNRFITHINLEGTIVVSHLPDPGRLKELLVPGAIVWLRPTPKGSDRKTKFSTIMVEHKGVLISLDSTLPNRFFKEAFNTIPIFKDWEINRSEIRIKENRIDFLLNDPEGIKVLTEVKSVTFVENGIAKFPDAVTERGRQHADLLRSLAKEGKRTIILFICQRPDAIKFQPMWDRDPALSESLIMAQKAGVDIRCITTDLDLKEMTFKKEIPVNLTPPNES